MQARLPPLGGDLDGLLDLKKHIFELLGPRLLLLLKDGGQFTQMMGIAQSVVTAVAPVGAPTIMDRSTTELGKDTDGLKSHFAALGMALIVSQRWGAGNMQPVQLGSDTLTCLVKMSAFGLCQRLLNLCLDIGKTRIRLVGGLLERAFAER